MKQVIAITAASSGFGALTARELAQAGHIVYACMSDTKGRNAAPAKAAKRFAAKNNVDLRTIELNGSSPTSADEAIQRIVSDCGRLDVVIHNTGHVVFGPTEAFTPEQLAQLYDINVLSTQRVNRAALPVLRQQGEGLVMWIGSSNLRGGAPPYLGPYFSAKAGMEALAVSYAAELARWNIETAIIIPGVFISAADDFAHPESPDDRMRLNEYASGPTAGLARRVIWGFDWSAPADAGALRIAKAIVTVVDMPFGTRPLRLNVDPAQERTHIVNDISDRIRAEMFREKGLDDLLNPSSARSIEVYS